MSEYTRFTERAKAQHGDKFTTTSLAPQFIPYLNGPRIEVTTTYPDGTTWTRRGRVGVTGGWAPVFILMPRVDSVASSDTLDSRDVIVRVVSK